MSVFIMIEFFDNLYYITYPVFIDSWKSALCNHNVAKKVLFEDTF